jgi:5-methylthioadenosine/S-adenosylhomocysteine deaminase
MSNTPKLCDLFIADCTLLTETYTIREHVSVAIRDSHIVEIGEHTAMAGAYQAAQTISGAGKLLMPGFVDGHTHVCQQLLRGRSGGHVAMNWTGVLVPWESSLTPQDVRVSTRMACLEMIKAGFTSFADAGGVHMDQAAEGILESGMRAAICRSTMDIGDVVSDKMKESIPDTMRRFRELYDAYDGKGEGRLQIWLGLREVMTCSPELMRQVGDAARELHTGIHAHLCEHRDEVLFSLQHYGLRPAELLADTGVLGPNLLTAHNVLLSDRDIALLADSGTHVIHCPKANLGNHGFPRVATIQEHGATIGLGCDGASGVNLDMFELMRLLQLATIAYYGLPIFDKQILPVEEMLKMATLGGAAALGCADSLGTVSEGKKADLILLDIHQPHLYPTQDLTVTLALCAHGRDVTDSIIDGKLVMKDRQVLTLDEEQVMAEAQTHMTQCVRRAGI